MTDQEIAHALEQMIRDDAQRPPLEQIRDLIEAGVIDEQGHVLVGSRTKNKKEQKPTERDGPGKH